MAPPGLGVKEYRNLPVALKDQLHAWLKEHGIGIDNVFYMEISGEEILVYFYHVDALGRKYMDKARGEPAQGCRHVMLKRQPPKGVFR